MSSILFMFTEREGEEEADKQQFCFLRLFYLQMDIEEIRLERIASEIGHFQIFKGPLFKTYVHELTVLF